MIERFAHWLFRWRTPLIIGFTLLTGYMAWSAAHLRVDASFNKSLPLDHPYIRTFTQYQNDFGGANRVLIALVPAQGDIFNATYFATLKRVT
ncbi:MAG: RND family transporter, partial [Opitutaceae bacterium]|nr:RND family transporter [Opitutaceae bacterium]